MTQQPQTYIHQGIFSPIFSNSIQFSQIYLQFPFPLCNPQSHCTNITVPIPFTCSPTCLNPFYWQISMQAPITPRWLQGFTGDSSYTLGAVRFFHVKSLIVIYSCFPFSALPMSFHICSSSPFNIICKYFPYLRSLMKMLINVRAHAVVTHQKPLCNSMSLPSFCLCFWSLCWHSGHAVGFVLLRKTERRHKCDAGGFGNVPSIASFLIKCVCPPVQWGQLDR